MALANLIDYDMNELKIALTSLIHDAARLSGHGGFGTHFFKWLASFAAIYLLILDRTNWRTNMLTSLLVPYIFFSLPTGIFHLLRGEVGKWIAFIAVVLRLFFHRHFPDWFVIVTEQYPELPFFFCLTSSISGIPSLCLLPNACTIYFGGVTTEYSQNELDELRDLWIKYVDGYKQVDEEYSEDNDDFN
ncbi:cold-regulated 413 plasma membrane protein 2-like [Beta vulgaris subsp. vulgaris]|uniref:cold-regulated 413 plasma membrane protein 2-like n=1 Tax=Beta vulgaris subsp. vulgaris TaxID=3555 RepID=UPI002548F63F|nr:cold-regulated 413 plasma membrane protein 2-like [Beta vulgaris subsp. vulgaris]